MNIWQRPINIPCFRRESYGRKQKLPKSQINNPTNYDSRLFFPKAVFPVPEHIIQVAIQVRSDLCVAFIAQVLQGSTRRHSRLPMGPHGNLAYRFHRGPYLRLFELFFSQATDRCGRRYTDNYNIKWGLAAKATDRYGKNKSSDGAEAETYGGSAGIPGLWTQVLV